MIPLKLTIEGLYSYRRRQTIDFTNLTQSGLFGIFGGVGSGKSSILEAISYALYGESQRLNSRGDDRNYNMMNLKSDALLIDFEFRSGPDNLYRFVVSGKRNNKKFEDVKAFDRSAYFFENEQWAPIPTESIESITGLNYGNFHRTIIIPQGKFQEFLQLSPAERTGMLKELFNLSKYDLFDKISRLDGKNLGAIQLLTGEMQGIGEVDLEKITELENKKVQLKDSTEALKKDQGEKEKVEQQFEVLKKLVAAMVEKKKQVDLLKRSEAGIQELERKIREYEKITRVFKSDTLQLAETENSYKENSGQLKSTKELLERHKVDFDKIQPIYEGLKKSFDSKEQLTKESEELLRYSEVKNLEATLNQLSVNAEALIERIEGTAGLVSEGKKKQEEKGKEVEKLRKAIPDIRNLAEIKAWFKEKKRLQKDILERTNKIAEIHQAIMNAQKGALTELTGSGFFESIPGTASLGQLLEMIDVRKSQLEGQLNVLDTQKSDLEVRHKLEEFAAELHDDKPCPLCGSKVHPIILNPTDVAGHLEILGNKEKKLKDLFKACQQLEKNLSTSQNRMAYLIQQKQDLEKELLAVQKVEKDHAENFTWKEYDPVDENKVLDEEKRYEQINSAIGMAEKDLKEIRNTIEKNGELCELLRNEKGTLDQQITKKRGQRDLLKTQIVFIETELLTELSPDQLLKKSEDLKKHYDKIVRDFNDMVKKRDDLNSVINTLDGQVSILGKSNEDIFNRLKKLGEKLDLKLQESGGLDLSYVLAILEQDIDVDLERIKVEEFHRSMEALKKSQAELEKELSGRMYDEVKHELLKEDIRRLKQQIEEMNQEMGRLETVINRMKSDAQKYAVLKADLERAQLRGRDIAELKNLFRGSGFVNYVSTIYLQNLCIAANERFYRLTRQNLGLELADDNSFKVRDYMNEGRLRSVKTLSGGQTFQASLSLALSLADSIHRIAGSSENFFFLDEGFGTLDKETLEVAFDTLKSLRKENRIVGVISHVEEMQAEIETYLKVTIDEEHGSIVRASWELWPEQAPGPGF